MTTEFLAWRSGAICSPTSAAWTISRLSRQAGLATRAPPDHGAYCVPDLKLQWTFEQQVPPYERPQLPAVRLCACCFSRQAWDHTPSVLCVILGSKPYQVPASTYDGDVARLSLVQQERPRGTMCRLIWRSVLREWTFWSGYSCLSFPKYCSLPFLLVLQRHRTCTTPKLSKLRDCRACHVVVEGLSTQRSASYAMDICWLQLSL